MTTDNNSNPQGLKLDKQPSALRRGNLGLLRAPSNGPQATVAGGGRRGARPTCRAPPAEAGHGPVERANEWYRAQGWLVGANYVTSTAINQIEMFQPGTYDPGRIDRELGVGRQARVQHCARLPAHDQLWAQDPPRCFQKSPGTVCRRSRRVTTSSRSSSCSSFAGIRCRGQAVNARRYKVCTTPAGFRARAPIVCRTRPTPASCRAMSPEWWACSATILACSVGTCGMSRTTRRAITARSNTWTSRNWSPRSSHMFSSGCAPSIPVQPLTSGVWQGRWEGPGSRSAVYQHPARALGRHQLPQLWRSRRVCGPHR